VTRLLDEEELARQLLDLPGVYPGALGTLTLALRAPTFADAVQLVQLVGEDADQLDHHPDIDLRWRTVTVTMSTHSAGGVTQLDIELAHHVLACAKAVGAQALPPPQRVEIVLDCADADAVRPFWAAALGYREHRSPDDGIELAAADGRGPVLWFQSMDPPRPGRGRFHLDVHVPLEQAPERVQACLDAGGRLISDAHAPSWWVLADPEGNEACVCTRAADPAP
jgi:4a-hydroxytetrahydrobiopterin dehydratase